ncbi:MAG: O-antigen polymerase [Solirubrobacteraceae bacterium]|nr:O-antigen polymerase [Solirubrobacteraceae bacterium]
MSLERTVAALVAAGLLAGAILAVRCAQRRLGAPVDVVALFLAVWGGVLLVFAVPVLDYTHTSLTAWLLIYGSIATTIVGCLLAWRRIRPAPPPIAEQRRSLRATIDPRRLRLVWLASAVVGLVGFAAFVNAVAGVAGWQAVFSDPATVRVVKRDSLVFQDDYGLWKILTYFNQVAFILWTIGLRMGVFQGRWRAAAVLGCISLVPFVFTADRNLMAAALTLAAMVHLLWPWAGSWRRVALVSAGLLAVAAVGLTAMGNRYGGSLEGQPAVAAQLEIPALREAAIPYLYVTGSLPTFGQLTGDALAPLTLGQMTTLPAVKAAARARLVDTAPVETGVFYPIPFESFSNYGWLGVFWLDFRAFGVLLLPMLLGFVATAARLRLAVRSTFLSLWTSAILLYIVVYSPLSNVLYTSLTWQHLLLGMLIAVLLDPQGARRAMRRVWPLPRRMAVPAAATTALAVAAALLLVVSSSARTAPAYFAEQELADAVEKARYVYERSDRYPSALGLATRLHVNRPAVRFQPLGWYTDPLPAAGVIGVFTQPDDLFLRVRAADGRTYEVHRTERDGGITFGPGTRDP